MTFRELAQEWLGYLEFEKGAKASTLRDYRWLLAEPGSPRRRGEGTAPGLLPKAFGDRAAISITTRDVAEYLRGLDRAGATPRTVNKHRQVISAIYGYAMREDSYGLELNPATATRKRREPPLAVLEFYEPEEVEAIARAAAAGAHRQLTSRVLYDDERSARAAEDRQDAELYRVPAYTGLRLGEVLALRWEDVHLSDRRHRPPVLVGGRRGSDEELAGALHPDRRSRGTGVRPTRRTRRVHRARRLRLLLTPRTGHSTVRRCASGSSVPPPEQASACSASTRSATAPARSSPARPTSAGCKGSSATRS